MSDDSYRHKNMYFIKKTTIYFLTVFNINCIVNILFHAIKSYSFSSDFICLTVERLQYCYYFLVEWDQKHTRPQGGKNFQSFNTFRWYHHSIGKNGIHHPILRFQWASKLLNFSIADSTGAMLATLSDKTKQARIMKGKTILVRDFNLKRAKCSTSHTRQQ